MSNPTAFTLAAIRGEEAKAERERMKENREARLKGGGGQPAQTPKRWRSNPCSEPCNVYTPTLSQRYNPNDPDDP